MHDTGKIVTGLVLFLVVVTVPMWIHFARGTVPEIPEPVIAVAGENCVRDADYMRTYHMDLLNEWRDDVVRRNDRIHVAPDGKAYDKSLSRTCMGCHYNKTDFCDQCHDYAGVTPYCWDCHVEPMENP
jgi:hypothetical protein